MRSNRYGVRLSFLSKNQIVFDFFFAVRGGLFSIELTISDFDFHRSIFAPKYSKTSTNFCAARKERNAENVHNSRETIC